MTPTSRAASCATPRGRRQGGRLDARWLGAPVSRGLSRVLSKRGGGSSGPRLPRGGRLAARTSGPPAPARIEAARDGSCGRPRHLQNARLTREARDREATLNNLVNLIRFYSSTIFAGSGMSLASSL